MLSGRVKSVVIVGAGPIGIEDAETLRHMGLEVHVVEVFDRVLPRMLDKFMADKYMKPLEEEGINFYLNHQVVAIKIIGGFYHENYTTLPTHLPTNPKRP